MVTLREEGRLPIRIIQWYLETVHQLHLSVGAIVQAVHGVARQAETAVREVLEQVRASPVVQGDETGWRQDGSNGYVWTFSTPSERYFLRRGRIRGWWMRCWIPPSAECWSVISTPPITTTRA